MITASMERALGVFSTKDSTEAAIDKLRSNGFPAEQISVLVANEDESDQSFSSVAVKEVKDHKPARTGAAVGGIGGAVLGALESLGVTTTALALLPGAGQVIMFGTVAANTLATAVVGGAAGAAGGGLVGGLVEWGIPEEHAKIYQDKVIEGQYLLMLEGDRKQIETAQSTLNPTDVREWAVYSAR